MQSEGRHRRRTMSGHTRSLKLEESRYLHSASSMSGPRQRRFGRGIEARVAPHRTETASYRPVMHRENLYCYNLNLDRMEHCGRALRKSRRSPIIAVSRAIRPKKYFLVLAATVPRLICTIQYHCCTPWLSDIRSAAGHWCSFSGFKDGMLKASYAPS